MGMLAKICREVNNWFQTEIWTGQFKIENGIINLDKIIEEGDLQNGQYFRIMGSIFNDGVYEFPAEDLKDETFNGAVWCMAVPQEFLQLVEDIEKWESTYAEFLNSPYQSESFGGYSYSKASGESGGAVTWKSQFKPDLNKWRKI